MKLLDKIQAYRFWLLEALAVTLAVALTQFLFDSAGIPIVGGGPSIVAILVICILGIDRAVMSILSIAAPQRRRR